MIKLLLIFVIHRSLSLLLIYDRIVAVIIIVITVFIVSIVIHNFIINYTVITVTAIYVIANKGTSDCSSINTSICYIAIKNNKGTI